MRRKLYLLLSSSRYKHGECNLPDFCVYYTHLASRNRLPGKQDSVEWLREKLEEARATIRSMAEAAQNAPSSGAVTGTETPMFIRSSAGTPDNSQSIGNRHSSDDPTESVAELVHHSEQAAALVRVPRRVDCHTVSLDDAGSLQHYGTSSLLYQKPSETMVSAKLLMQARQTPESGETSSALANQPDWQSLAYSTLMLQEQHSNAERQWQLVQTYFTWLNPVRSASLKTCIVLDSLLNATAIGIQYRGSRGVLPRYGFVWAILQPVSVMLYLCTCG